MRSTRRDSAATPPRRARAFACTALLTLALAGCAGQPVRATGSWNDKVPTHAAFSRVLVLAVTPQVNARCGFERALADDLRSEGVDAKPSCAVMSTDEKLTRESVERAAAAMGADAVIATRLVAVQHKLTEGGTTETRGAGYYKPIGTGWETGYWGAYSVPVIYGEYETAPAVWTLQGTVHIVTQVYSTRDASLVYSLETVGKGIASREQALAEVPPVVAETLHRDGVVR